MTKSAVGRGLGLLLLSALANLGSAERVHATAAANDHTVLILDSTVTGGAGSREAIAAGAAGLSVEVVSAAGWASKSASDFASYRALILGDPTCVVGPSPVAAAIANRTTWSPAVNGNVILIGTDPVYHAPSEPGAGTLITKGVAFAADKVGKTGLYCALSCYYHNTAPFTPVPLLDQFGTFTVTGVGCYNNAHIVATSPALTGLTDADLSNWSCSVHEAFDTWPSLTFDVLAIARDIGSSYTAPDGSVGTPYVLARGVTVISDIKLTPEDATNNVGTTHTVCATVTTNGTAIPGVTVTFSVIAGPNTGVTGSSVTDTNGVACFTYADAGGEGQDFIQAQFKDSAGHTQTSNRATKEWVKPTCHLDCKDVVVCNDPGQCSAAVGTYDVGTNASACTVVCEPPAGTTFGAGTNSVTCVARDGSNIVDRCTFSVIVKDCEAPQTACRAATNPSGKKIPVAGKNPKSGQNPDGFYQLLGKDNCDANPVIYVGDSGSTFVAGPFHNGDIVKIVQAPGGPAFQQPGPQDIVAQIHLIGDALVYAVDASGNVGASVGCKVPPPPK